MSEMIERVAKAIAAEVAGCPITPEIPHTAYLPVARAAIQAMREPTKEMAEEGGYLVAGERANPEDARNVWIEMIGVALQASETSGS